MHPFLSPRHLDLHGLNFMQAQETVFQFMLHKPLTLYWCKECWWSSMNQMNYILQVKFNDFEITPSFANTIFFQQVRKNVSGSLQKRFLNIKVLFKNHYYETNVEILPFLQLIFLSVELQIFYLSLLYNHFYSLFKRTSSSKPNQYFNLSLGRF